MKILGIDPGSRVTGYGLIEKSGNKFTHLESGILKFDKEKEFLNRVPLIYSSIFEVFEDLKPDVVALESLIYKKSPTALIKLGQTRGAILAAIMQNGFSKVFEYSPNLIKSTTAGHGHADKEAVQKFVQMTLKVKDFQTSDESDALAVALTHGHLGGAKVGTKSAKNSSLEAAVRHRIG